MCTKNLSYVVDFCYARETEEDVMQSSKHWAALAFLGAFGVLIAVGSKNPARRIDASASPPGNPRDAALVTAFIDSTSDACAQASADGLDSASKRALQEACLRAAEDKARTLEWRDDDWEIVHPGNDSVGSNPAKATKTPRVARRTGAGRADDAAPRNR